MYHLTLSFCGSLSYIICGLMIFAICKQLLISCWIYPNNHYWDRSSLVFLLLNLNNCIIFFPWFKIQENVVGKICSHGKPEFNCLPVFSWNNLNWRQILQGSQWTFKWTFLKGLKRLKGQLFKRSLASDWQNRVLSHFHFFNAFILTPVMANVSWQQQGRLGSYTSPYGTVYTIFPWPI